ncbi:MAG: C25 family cysteine peptidase [Eubacteriales bacterium]
MRKTFLTRAAKGLLLVLLTFAIVLPMILPVSALVYWLPINRLMRITLAPGETKEYGFNVADTDYYIIETSGSLDTYITVEGLSVGTLTNDDGGRGKNACVGFVGEPTLVVFKVRCASPTDSGETTILLRRQTAVLYGFNYQGINTIPALTTPYTVLTARYDAFKYTSNSVGPAHALGVGVNKYVRLNSEVVFFAGHGFGTPNGNKGYGVLFPAGNLFVCELPVMDNVKVVVWEACYSSNTSNTYNTSLVKASVDLGARSAIGWPDSIIVVSARTFTNRFFDRLATGSNVGSAAQYAKSGIIWPWDNVRNYTLLGDPSVTITNHAVYYPSSNRNATLLREFESRLASKERFQTYDNNDGTVRVYKTINGCLTNDFYDVTREGKQIVDVQHSGIRYDKQLILEPREFAKKAPAASVRAQDILFDRLVDVQTYRIYYLEDQVAIPIEIRYCTYESAEGYTYVDAVCTNLYDNTAIDYALICGME